MHLRSERVDTVHLAEAVSTAIRNRDREREVDSFLFTVYVTTHVTVGVLSTIVQ
jgi:hypothetical protein